MIFRGNFCLFFNQGQNNRGSRAPNCLFWVSGSSIAFLRRGSKSGRYKAVRQKGYRDSSCDTKNDQNSTDGFHYCCLISF